MLSKTLSLLLGFWLISISSMAQLNPTAPDGLEVTSVTNTSIKIEWDDNSNNESFFSIERSKNNTSNWTEIATTGVNVESFTDFGLEEKTKYYYRVRAGRSFFFSVFYSSYSNSVNETTLGAPEAPTNLTASTISQSSIELNWQPGSDDATAFKVERALGNGTFSQIFTINETITTATNLNLTSNTNYRYRVRASNIYGNSPYSNIVNASTFQHPPTIAAIPDLEPILENSGNKVINLSGISAGGSEVQTISVTATSSNKNVIPDPTVTYTSPGSTGKISFTPLPNSYGFSTITVTVTDSGPSTPAGNVNVIVEEFKVEVIRILPDLTSKAIQMNDLVCEGEAFEVSHVIENVGNKNSGPSKYHVYLSQGDKIVNAGDDLVASLDLPAIAAGSSHSLTYDITLDETIAEGPVHLIALIDAENQVEESNENNNNKSREFSFCLPELLVGNLSVSADRNAKGENIDLSFDISNAGILNAKQFEISYFLEDAAGTLSEGDKIGSTIINGLGIDVTQTVNEVVTIPDNASPGNYMLTIWLDSKGEIPESDENNNFESTEFEIANLADLSIETMSANPAIIGYGQTLKINTTITNSGVIDAPPSEMKYYLSLDSLISKEDITFSVSTSLDALPVSEQVSFSAEIIIPENILEGSYVVIAQVDDANVIQEYNESDNYAPYLINILSDLPPIITATNFPEWSVAGTNNTIIQVEATDDTGISAVYFKYKGIRSTVWDSTMVHLVNANENWYGGSIPGAFFDELGLEYYFIVFDEVGLQVESERGFTYIEHPGDGLPFSSLNFGENISDYNIVAFPLTLNNNSVVAALEDDLGPYDDTKWRLFEFSGGDKKEYKTSFDNLSTGKGYWLLSRNNASIDTGPGKSVKAHQGNLFTIQLEPGWNMIGNPYNFDVKWSQVLAVNGFPADISGEVKVYNKGFKNVDVLGALEGGFIYTSNTTELRIPVRRENPNTINGRFAGNSTDRQWKVFVSVGNNQVKHEIYSFGMHDLAQNGQDQFDELNFPAENFLMDLRLRFNNESEQISYLRDISGYDLNHKWDITISNQSEEKYTYISWKPDGNWPDEGELVLFNPNTGQKINMKQQAGLWVEGKKETKLQILFGEDQFIENNAMVKHILLG